MGNEMSEGEGIPQHPTPIPYERSRQIHDGERMMGRSFAGAGGVGRGGSISPGIGDGIGAGRGSAVGGSGGGGSGQDNVGGRAGIGGGRGIARGTGSSIETHGGHGRGIGRGGGRGETGQAGRQAGGWTGSIVGGFAGVSPPHTSAASPAFVIPGRDRGRGNRAPAEGPGRGSTNAGQKPSSNTPRISDGSRVKNKTAPPMDDQPPEADLSHLTEEERTHILAVLNRARGLQERDEERVRNLEEDFTRYTKDIKRRASDASSIGEGQAKNLCPVCNRTELDKNAIPGSAQEGLECTDCERPVCLQCGFYMPALASQIQNNRSDQGSAEKQAMQS
nr:uncharacterized protein LOC129255379 [Lytechinus pictus]